jgi:hypothetical protein
MVQVCFISPHLPETTPILDSQAKEEGSRKGAKAQSGEQIVDNPSLRLGAFA